MALIELTKQGLYCAQADVYIDPWKSVPKALITHAHSDHARSGNGLYVAHEHCIPLLDLRLGKINSQGVKYGEGIHCNGVQISFHPAGHVPGSSQIRVEYKGEVWVISGDYKLEDDGVCSPFESVKCHSFISESTFGLPIYRWKEQGEVYSEINSWWKQNAADGIVSVIMAYSLGKAQRILMHLDQEIGQVIVHPVVGAMNAAVRNFTPDLPADLIWHKDLTVSNYRNALLIVPPNSAQVMLEMFHPCSIAFASGWMNFRGGKYQMSAERGFTLSDHADWQGLNKAIDSSEAEQVFITHGFTKPYVKWLREQGKDAYELETLFNSHMESEE
ncbi:MAG: ligase-associated DNA damage response exonuclease [Bacteroidetes bacterium]|nr:ligase-associated DNA damage response exonuclease [Bacteroidota bacterium]